MLQKLIITACVEAILLTAAALIDPQFLKDNAVWVIVAAFTTLLSVALYEWLRASGRENGGGVTQTTHGPHSPNYGTVRDVHNYYGPPNPAAKQEAKSPYGSGKRVVRGDTGRALAQMLQDDDLSRLARRPSMGEIYLRRAHAQLGQCPKMPIHIALHYIAARVGDADKEQGFPKARQQFRQAAHEGDLDVWGQRQVPPTHLQDNRHKGVWSRIDPEHWEDHFLHPRSMLKAQQNQPHTKEEEIGRISNRYWSLKVRPEDIDRRWPEPRRTTNDGKP